MLPITISPVPACSPATTTAGPARIGRATRWLAAAVLFFLADAAQLLWLAPDRTAELFAWPIDPHVTSLVLGSAYLAGGYFFARVMFVDAWHRVAAGFPSVIVFVWLAALSTALHLDRFTHDSLPFAAWAAIYAAAPLGLPLLYLAQRHVDRGRSDDTPMPRRLRIAMGCAGGAVTFAALLAFAVPQATIDVWPWTLTPLTARIVATVMALFGSLWLSVSLRGGTTAARIPLEAHAVGLAFLLLAAARAHGDVDWANPLAVCLVIGVAAMVVVDLWVRAHLSRPRG
ncbi:MAG: hypothetical protein ABWZ67_15000 [Solirubrobacteraceae bacterium]